MTDEAGWSGGYVTDTPYTQGYYPQQSPGHLALDTTLAGYDADQPGPDDPLDYLELGCGRGFGAMVLAAANPKWRITAIDYNPAHIAEARRTASDVGLSNIRFLEADLATLPDEARFSEIPEADVATLHGVWSWVAPSVRAGIVRLLRARVRSGGLVHVSYNALPGWQGSLLLQRLVFHAGRHLARGSTAQAQAGLAVVRDLLAAGAVGLTASLSVKAILERLDDSPAAYIVHEYMNEHWQPCWQADVAADMAGAKLDYVASAQTLANFPELMANPEQRAVLDRFQDPLLRELVLDSCKVPQLRHDIFARGARRLSVAARDTILERLTLALTIAPENFVYSLDVPAGKAALNEAFYRPMVERLWQGPATVAELLALDQRPDPSRNPAEVVGTMVGSYQAVVMERPGATMTKGARRLNDHTADRVRREAIAKKPTAMACPVLAGGLIMRSSYVDVAQRLAATDGADPALVDTKAWARDAAPPGTEPARIEEVAKGVRAVLDDHGKLWRWLGLA